MMTFSGTKLNKAWTWHRVGKLN